MLAVSSVGSRRLDVPFVGVGSALIVTLPLEFLDQSIAALGFRLGR